MYLNKYDQVQVWSSKDMDIGLIEKFQSRAFKVPHLHISYFYEKSEI